MTRYTRHGIMISERMRIGTCFLWTESKFSFYKKKTPQSFRGKNWELMWLLNQRVGLNRLKRRGWGERQDGAYRHKRGKNTDMQNHIKRLLHYKCSVSRYGGACRENRD